VKFFTILAALLIGLSSCFEIIEELDLNKDNSGSFTYTLNMSESRMELNTMFKLDSFRGKKIPSKNEIAKEMEKAIQLIRKNPGIKTAVYTKNWEDYIFEYKVSFDSLSALDNALKSTYSKLDKDKHPLKDRLFAVNGVLKRVSSLDSLSLFKKLNSKDAEGLSKATYTCVYRLSHKIKSMSNPNANKSKSGKAVMLKSDIKSLLTKKKSLKNTITFIP